MQQRRALSPTRVQTPPPAAQRLVADRRKRRNREAKKSQRRLGGTVEHCTPPENRQFTATSPPRRRRPTPTTVAVLQQGKECVRGCVHFVFSILFVLPAIYQRACRSSFQAHDMMDNRAGVTNAVFELFWILNSSRLHPRLPLRVFHRLSPS